MNIELLNLNSTLCITLKITRSILVAHAVNSNANLSMHPTTFSPCRPLNVWFPLSIYVHNSLLMVWIKLMVCMFTPNIRWKYFSLNNINKNLIIFSEFENNSKIFEIVKKNNHIIFLERKIKHLIIFEWPMTVFFKVI